jgi:hypothetical protein
MTGDRDVQLEHLARAIVDRFVELERATLILGDFRTNDKSARMQVRAGYREDGSISIQLQTRAIDE